MNLRKIRNAIISNKVAFNWGAMSRHHDGYVKMAEAIASGQIGEPRYAVMLTHTDLIKHHPHTIDLVQMQLGDPEPIWVEGTLVKKGDLLEGGRSSGPKRRGRSPISGFPEYNAAYDINYVLKQVSNLGSGLFIIAFCCSK